MQHARRFAPAGALRALGYRLLWACSNWLQMAANACLYLAAGLLRHDDLRAASQAQWRHFSTSSDDVDAGLEVWERRFYGALLRSTDRVLLVGCGAGRDLVALRELGYDVTGLEQTPELVDLARTHLTRRGITATVQAGFVENCELDGAYDAVLFSSGCYSCLHPAASRVATLAKIKTHLSQGGRIVITYTGFGSQSPFSVWLTRISALVGRADWSPERGDSFSRGYRADRVLSYQHLFRPDEVARECAAAGLRLIRDETTGTPLYCAVAVP